MCADAPDTSGMEQVARETLAFNRQMYRDNKPILQGIAQGQIDAQAQQMEQGADYYQYMQDTFRPLEQGLVEQAQNFNTEEYRQQQAAQASAASARAFSTSQDMQSRSLAARGVNPNSGAARAGNNAMGLQQAAMRAQSMTGARNAAQQQATNSQYAAAALGRGLAANSSAAYGGATAAGSAGANTQQAAGSTYMQGLGQAGSAYGNVANVQASTYGAQMGMIGALAGAGAGVYAAGSDRRLKTDITMVGIDEKTQLPLYTYRYISDPTKLYKGVMSDDVRAKFPDAVVVMEDGYDAVQYGKLDIELQVVGE